MNKKIIRNKIFTDRLIRNILISNIFFYRHGKIHITIKYFPIAYIFITKFHVLFVPLDHII